MAESPSSTESGRTLAACDAELALARSSGDIRRITRALRHRANARIEAARFAGAVVDLDEAARLHKANGEEGEEARCLHLGATTARLAGDLEGSVARARAALDIVDPQDSGRGGPVAVAAWTELGESAFAKADNATAGECFDVAVQVAEGAGLLPVHLANLERRRAQAWAAADQPVRATVALTHAWTLAEEAGDAPLQLRCRIEEASAWVAAGKLDLAEPVIDDAGRMAGQQGDDLALADLELLRSTIALTRGHVQDALTAARSARALSLQGVHPVGYTAAALAMSELSERLGDRVAAYEALAVGWVTLGDLLGQDTGKATFAPKLQALADKWGRDEFVRVRDAYEARRKQELGRS